MFQIIIKNSLLTLFVAEEVRFISILSRNKEENNQQKGTHQAAHGENSCFVYASMQAIEFAKEENQNWTT